MLNKRIKQLVNYGLERELIQPEDEIYTINSLLGLFDEDSYVDSIVETDEIENILTSLCDIAIEKGIIEDSIASRDLFDTKLMGVLTPRPSEVISKFKKLYLESPKAATDYYYNFSKNTDYIRTYRIKKDMKWEVESDYGKIEITINLSKPEKDPKDIALAKLQKKSGYPQCALCKESEGYFGNRSFPARENHRIIPIDLCGEEWFFQYSPYVYYNEHCIVLSKDHTPMNVCTKTVERELDFISKFPHYSIGSNAGLPIVGGSILTHDHMQGGNYIFPMNNADTLFDIKFDGFDSVSAKAIKWPLSVIRLSSSNKDELIRLVDKIFTKWADYSDESVDIYAYTNGEPHNAITPISRKKGDKYEIDLALRNNITTEQRPMGLFHPRNEYHNIKKENIGLIEVMGLAILPSRLKKELEIMKNAILEGKDLNSIEEVQKHSTWFESFKNNYSFTSDNVEGILKEEVGKIFVKVLEDCGVFKLDEKGISAFKRFTESINE